MFYDVVFVTDFLVTCTEVTPVLTTWTSGKRYVIEGFFLFFFLTNQHKKLHYLLTDDQTDIIA